MSDQPIRDKEQPLSIEEIFSKAVESRRIDKFVAMLKMVDQKLRWYFTNIQKARHQEIILRARTWCKVNEARFEPYLTAPDEVISKADKIKLQAYIDKTNDIINGLSDDYAETRMSSKGFMSKLWKQILTGETVSEKELDKFFKGKDKQ